MKKKYFLYSLLISLFLGIINRPKDSSMPLIEIVGITIILFPFALFVFFIINKFINNENLADKNNSIKNLRDTASKAASDSTTLSSRSYTKEDSNEATIDILKESLIEITSKEEEEIYENASREFSENRKEGIWTKFLIQNDGNEQKAKFAYIKSRVQQFKHELIEIKRKKENDKIIKEEESKILKKLQDSKASIVTDLDYLINFYKKSETNDKVYIPTKLIEALTNKYNPEIHKTNLYPDLIELVKNLKNQDEDFIEATEIKKLINK